MVLFIFISLKSEFLILQCPCVINMCKADLESAVWAWGKRSLAMQGHSSKFWSSFQCMCSSTWNPVLCLIGLSARDNCLLFNRMLICGSLRRMNYGRNITERFTNRYFVTTMPCKVTIVAVVEKFWMTGSVLNQNKMEDMFYLKRRWMIQLLSGNKPQKNFIPVGSLLCGLSKVSAREGYKISETKPI